jgi:hypothetical protein
MGRPKKIATAAKTVADFFPGLVNLAEQANVKLECLCNAIQCLCKFTTNTNTTPPGPPTNTTPSSNGSQQH